MVYTKIEFHDRGPDEKGRRVYTLHWEDPFGVYDHTRARDKKPMGKRRKQMFRSAKWKGIIDSGVPCQHLYTGTSEIFCEDTPQETPTIEQWRRETEERRRGNAQ